MKGDQAGPGVDLRRRGEGNLLHGEGSSGPQSRDGKRDPNPERFGASLHTRLNVAPLNRLKTSRTCIKVESDGEVIVHVEAGDGGDLGVADVQEA